MASIGTGEAVTDRGWARLPTTTTRSSICTAISTSRVVAAPALISLDRTRSLLEAFHATWTWIDEPKFRYSVRQPDIEPAAWAYLRLHGRNATAWWHSQDRDERYRYAYAEDELAPIAERLMRTVAPQGSWTVV